MDELSITIITSIDVTFFIHDTDNEVFGQNIWSAILLKETNFRDLRWTGCNNAQKNVCW